MGTVRSFEPEKLVVAIMYTDITNYYKAIKILTQIYGKIETISREYVFSNFSNFYDNEMNGSVFKRFISFHKCLNPATLAEIKLQTNTIENNFTIEKKRTLNLDPCFLSHGKFVMATTKPASFRIPLQKGIYVDLSLVYSRGKWIDFYWTYADVKSDYIKDYLLEVRQRYLKQRKLQLHY